VKGQAVATPTISRLIRIRLHPDDPRLVLLDTPPQLATTMGRFEPARFVGMRNGAYMLPADLLDSLTTFARHHDVLLTDERATSTTGSERGRVVGPARPLPQCANCAQPTRRDHQPAYCASCGHPWQPIEHQGHAGDRDREHCTTCGATQSPGFGYCQRCGTTMTHTPAPPPMPATPRKRLEDPLPIGAVTDDVLQQQL
jgi:hypothetical protein